MKKLVLLACLISGYLNVNAQFTAGNLAVLRVGNGTSNLSNSAAAVSILEFQTNGTASGTSIALPNTTEGNRFVLNPTVNTEGGLRLSANGEYLVFGGYGAALGADNANTQGGTTTNSTKVFGRVAADGIINISTQFTMLGSNAIRSVVSNDGTGFWAVTGAASLGLIYIPFGSSTYTTVTATSYRSTLITGGQLYAIGNISKIGDGLPTASGTAATNYGTIGNAFSGLNAYGFVLFDMSDTEPGFDVLYVADQSGAAGLRKYSKVGGAWVSNGALDVTGLANTPATNPGILLDITGTLNEQNQPVLYASRGTGENNSLVSIIDPNGYNESINTVAPTFTHLASAGAKYTFKGVAFTPGTVVKTLPLDLLSFTSSLKNNSVSLKWTTENEVNVSAIEIERKLENTAFERIGTVSAKNSKTKTTYTFEDKNPSVGNNYYRLKIVDNDGTFKYSEVVIGKVVSLQANITLTLYPNPASNLLNVTFINANRGATLTVYDLNGRLVMKTSLEENATSKSIAIDKLNAGVYVIKFENNGKLESKTFVKR